MFEYKQTYYILIFQYTILTFIYFRVTQIHVV